jgi:hypothetical protein
MNTWLKWSEPSMFVSRLIVMPGDFMSIRK